MLSETVEETHHCYGGHTASNDFNRDGIFVQTFKIYLHISQVNNELPKDYPCKAEVVSNFSNMQTVRICERQWVSEF